MRNFALPGADRLRYTKFVGLRDDKDPRSVLAELQKLVARAGGNSRPPSPARRVYRNT
jgi:hypothetical protein